MAAFLREGIDSGERRQCEALNQEEVRQLPDQALNFSRLSSAAAFEAAHPSAELLVAPSLRTQNVPL